MLENYTKLSKIEIATYLRDYFLLMMSLMKHPEKRLIDIFQYNMNMSSRPQNVTLNHYDNVMLIYDFFLLVNYFGIVNDLNLGDLDESQIENIETFKNIFVNKEDYDKFTKKQIIRYIRNAISHNDKDDRELYHLYKYQDELFIEIKLKQTKPVPFHVLLKLEDYIQIMKQLHNVDRQIIFKVVVPENIKIKNYINKLDEIEMQCIELKNHQQNIISSSKLSEHQKEKIITLVEQYSKRYKHKFEELLKYFVKVTAPIGVSKLNDLWYDFTILQSYIKDDENNLRDIMQKTSQYRTTKDYQTIFNHHDFGRYLSFSLAIYSRYMLDTVITEKEIKIEDKVYSRNKLRNSFTHGRWYFGEEGNLHLYDSSDNNKSSYEYNWYEEIEGFKFCSALIDINSEMYDSAIKSGNTIGDNSIAFNFNKETNHIMNITVNKNNKLYIYNLNVDSRVENYLIWGLYVIDYQGYRLVKDPMEASVFFNELSNLSHEEKSVFSDIINLIKPQYQQVLRYENGLITYEELNKYNNIISLANYNIDSMLEEANKRERQKTKKIKFKKQL